MIHVDPKPAVEGANKVREHLEEISERAAAATRAMNIMTEAFKRIC